MMNISENKNKHGIAMLLWAISGADPGFVVRGGGVSRRWSWGPVKVPSGSRVEP